MIAISVVFGLHVVRVDPGLLRERLKPPMQKDQPLADKLVLIPILLLCSAAWDSWRRTPRAGAGRSCRHPCKWAGSGAPPRGDLVHVLDDAREQLRGAGRENTEGARADGHHHRALRDRAPSALFRRAVLRRRVRRWCSARGGAWRRSRSSRSGLAIRIGVEEKALREGLEGYDDYARRLRWRLIPLIW